MSGAALCGKTLDNAPPLMHNEDAGPNCTASSRPSRQAPVQPASQAAPRTARGTVLVVGCDPDTTRILTLSLEKNGFRVVLARDGADALAQARALRPAVVVSGMRVARRTGRTLRAALADDPATAGTHVVAVCSIPPALVPGAPLPDADRTLVLPFSPSDLLGVIESLAA
jgi:chemosensory pili system protein ChpA (sensor histidine kinase/response regulator)